MIRVMVVDDHPIWVRAVSADLTEAGFDVVATAADGAEALRRLPAARPDVVVLDLHLPVLDGVGVTREVIASGLGAQVLVLSSSGEQEDVLEAVKAGACGYLVHGHFGADDLLQAVRLAARGIATFSSQALAVLSNPVPTRAALARRFGLSEREAEVMERVAKGSSNTEIAGEMFLSEKTVKNYINKLFAKMHANNRGHAVSLWLSGP